MEKKNKPKDTNVSWGINDSLKKYIITKHRFKKEFSEHKECFWYRRNIPHPLFKNLHVLIDSDRVSVWCDDLEGAGEVIIIRKNFTEKNLSDILKFLLNSRF